MTLNDEEIRVRFTYQRDLKKWVIPVTDEMRKMFGTMDDSGRPTVVTEGTFRIEFPLGKNAPEGSYIVFNPHKAVIR
jgi:hypothetical protein